ncbi:PREDICTED: ATP-dependent DNA helicase Q-like 3 [Branchiostoma belcheri]|uniref:DNA 3'-5' helicase n=1 Tax=Branchiostoma belcheri TaxID=7741 RepID=A0A6P4XP34_BRABE|nr:PREDICTED: ATP-dependent DNA helicase Q-like 3 [Branchiostoma belcheri]
MDTRARATRVAKDLWGFESLREAQLTAITAVSEGKDTFVGLATGQGKSICYQILPSISTSPTVVLVISPLHALVADQIHRYESVTGYKGLHLKNAGDIQQYMDGPDGSVRIVFMAPEQAVSPQGRKLLQTPPLPIQVVAVDEAHCIPEWGDDFRKTFKKIGSLRALLSKVPFMALTATATPDVCRSVMDALHMENPVMVKGSLDRPNIFLLRKKIKSTKEDFQPLVDHIMAAETVQDIKKHIVYATTKNTCMELWEELTRRCPANIKKAVRVFHADISRQAKKEVMEAFRDGSVRIVVASIAFGMGIDIPDIDGVVIYHVPATIGQLYQEIGRAGRAGQQASAVIFYGKGDVNKAPEDLKAFLLTDGCLREELLKHLGQDMEEQPDKCCSVGDSNGDDGDQETCFFLHQTESRAVHQPSEYRKRRADSKKEKELKEAILELRDTWYCERPELLLFGPDIVMADETVDKVVTKCRSIHRVEDLEKISGMPADKTEEILQAINSLFPEQRRKIRARRRRHVLGDIGNIVR